MNYSRSDGLFRSPDSFVYPTSERLKEGSLPDTERVRKPQVTVTRFYQGDGVNYPQREFVRVQTLTLEQVAQRDRLVREAQQARNEALDSGAGKDAQAAIEGFDKATSVVYDLERLLETARTDGFVYEQCQAWGLPVSKY